MKSIFGIYGEAKSETWEFNLPFKTKAEYLEWRANWKRQYKELSEAIRLAKVASRKRQSYQDAFAQTHNAGKDIQGWFKRLDEVSKLPEYASLRVDEDMALQRLRAAMSDIESYFKQDPCNIQWDFWAAKQARWMLALRKASKIEAGRQYQASLEQSRQNQTVMA